MQIEEEGAQMSVAQIVERKEEKDKAGSDGFEFQLISIDDPRCFFNFKSKENQDRFFKW
jgi:hypothetical protein